MEKEITKLSPEEYKKFRDWFDKYEAEQWDKQFEKDVQSGKLDALAKEAIQAYKDGNCPEM